MEKKVAEKKPVEQALVRVKPDSHGPLDERKQAELVDVRRTIHGRLLEYLDLRKLDFNKVSEQSIRTIGAQPLISDILHEMRDEVRPGQPGGHLQGSPGRSPGAWASGGSTRDPEVTEIMVNNKEQIFYERHGKLLLSDKRFTSNKSLIGCDRANRGPARAAHGRILPHGGRPPQGWLARQRNHPAAGA